MNSKYLDEIIHNSNRTANLQVVFVDIIKYSQRRTLNQIAIIDKFMECIKNALTNTSKEYVTFCQANDINFLKDIIFIPTGDGAAIVFPFNGLHDIHLFFAKNLLELINDTNNYECEKYMQNKWCNCHNNFAIRVGISEGKGIIYKDINDNYNVAGNVINMAARVMDFADDNQILFSEEAFKQIIDLDDKPDLIDNFIEFKNVKIKHGNKINIYQFIDEDLRYINSKKCEQLMVDEMMETVMEQFKDANQLLSTTSENEIDKIKVVKMIGKMAEFVKALSVPDSDKLL